ncbi:MAG: hypothetical protein K2J90_05390 [Lachnospiraceae bacterium]|nr:hypothetical protein [Lachnospiraceae bacterium]
MKKGGIAVISSLVGGIVGAAAVGKMSQDTIKEKDGKTNKFKSYYTMLNQWLCIKQQNGNLSDYFKENNYNKIAIYGLGEMGSRLISELNGTEIEVVYGLDKKVDNIFCDIKAYSLDDIENISDKVDVVVVTAIFAYDEIEEELREKFDCDIISLEDVVFEI